MLFSDERDKLRQLFFDAWKKYLNKQTLIPLEQQVVDVILLHPEYHTMLANKDKFLDKDYTPDMGQTNPFLHMSLHLGIIEQVSTNRPKGIQSLYQHALTRFQDPHIVEHKMIEVLAQAMWEMQRSQSMMDETVYLDKLKQVLLK